MNRNRNVLCCFLVISSLISWIDLVRGTLPDSSIYDVILTKDENSILVPITLNEGASLNIRILCESSKSSAPVEIKYKFTERICKGNLSGTDPQFVETEKHLCGLNGPINLNRIEFQDKTSNRSKDSKDLVTIIKDGIYILDLEILSHEEFNASVNIKFQGEHGFLTAKDLPMLEFYAFMCVFYSFLALIWSVFSALHWNSLLRIQFWIGSVILLGMLEKACFYFEYHQANEYGMSSLSLALVAEVISCVKRTLSRILVLIVSMGFGITKSRLGDEANVRISVISILYFTMASIESYLRLVQAKDRNESKQLVLSAVPLALIDSLICWWIFTSLIQTIRALKLRRNVVKLQFYSHFQNVLIFGVGMSVIFMVYSIKMHKKSECSWKNLWIDQAFWHILFSILLSVICFLWRPNQNNQKYAFVPLLETEDEENDLFCASYSDNTKLRTKPPSISSHKEAEIDENLKWVEENLPTTLLLGDSDDEEISKFEISKMQ